MEEEMPVNVAISTPPSKTSGLPDSLMFASLDLSPEKRTILLFTGATPITFTKPINQKPRRVQLKGLS